MFLKTLTLKGFKSFADTTTLELEPGITVVVGPNGSGKSNVVDAVAWVLGAQGPRTVRSAKMDDVIFAGSANRPALGRAEVSLTIDNTSGLLPIEFAEVTISRTLFRNGDSEYALNGVPCRLLDVQELLSDSGVGRTQHVIVSQGQLDAILNASPVERRAVIEEAAGVLKYRRRKEKAERRLEATEASLLRLSDLLREVRRSLRPLERQAEAARRHGELDVELRAIRLHVAGRELASLRTRLESGAAARAASSTDEAGAAEPRWPGSTPPSWPPRPSCRPPARTTWARSWSGPSASGPAHRAWPGSWPSGAGAPSATGRSRSTRASWPRWRPRPSGCGASWPRSSGRARSCGPTAERVAEAEEALAGERAAFEEAWGDGVMASPSRGGEVRAELAALRTAAERGGPSRSGWRTVGPAWTRRPGSWRPTPSASWPSSPRPRRPSPS